MKKREYNGCQKEPIKAAMDKIHDEASKSATNDLLCCPYCGNEAEYFEGTNSQADAIYCKECPLGVEHAGMSFSALALVWNGLPRAT